MSAAAPFVVLHVATRDWAIAYPFDQQSADGPDSLLVDEGIFVFLGFVLATFGCSSSAQFKSCPHPLFLIPFMLPPSYHNFLGMSEAPMGSYPHGCR
jgi:hypothetical protein